MKFEVATNLKYTVLSPSTLVLNVHVLPTENQTILEESFIIEPFFNFEEIKSFGENRFVRFEISNPCPITVSYSAKVENKFKITNHEDTKHVKVMDMDFKEFTYLHPSRYCQSDKLYRFATHKFQNNNNPFLQVLELTNWINKNVEYLSGSTDTQTSAYDTVTQQAGVCRDFAHLGVALCRALTIPARYFTGYAYQLKPQDFHACFEAYLGGEWIIFDATKLAPLNGLVKIATGRDATDTAFANIFGNVVWNEVNTSCQLLEENFEPLFYQTGEFKGVSL